MTSPDVPRPNIVRFVTDMRDNAAGLVDEVEFGRRQLGSDHAPDALVLAHIFKTTGAGYIRSLYDDASRDKKPNGFYPGDIKFGPGKQFRQAGENQRIIMLNYTAAVYGLAVEMMEETMDEGKGLFDIGTFCARYNLLFNSTGYPQISPNDFPTKFKHTDDGLREVIDTRDARKLENSYRPQGVLSLFDDNHLHLLLPESLRWIFKKLHIYQFLPEVHGELRKQMRLLNTARRDTRIAMEQALQTHAALGWYEQFLDGLILDPNDPRGIEIPQQPDSLQTEEDVDEK